MKTKFNDQQLISILDQSLIYQCACPAQVAKQLIELRDLYVYQQNCVSQTETDTSVHQRIAAGAENAHSVLEECLEAVLMLENWDMETLLMPSNLQKTPRSI